MQSEDQCLFVRAAAPSTGTTRREPAEPVKEVALATFPTWTEATMCAEQLEGEGIPSVLVPLGPGAGGWGSSAFVPHELRVRATDLERAREILDEGDE